MISAIFNWKFYGTIRMVLARSLLANGRWQISDIRLNETHFFQFEIFNLKFEISQGKFYVSFHDNQSPNQEWRSFA
ncbi:MULTISPECIES: hypothetical protein [Oscillatoriales]|uniref:Uncharacterized protein n=1 Tax=Aerosakkonema funiforme FACHB-1375 TaxID=2949571 RepID=A0A926V9Z4_9CYAN|nr:MULTISPECIES: hypothetical protein [Oscillatoriales]MBD2180016.1 hypothetical protein [Aerosakkonema funiforme FACHB-1375]